MTEASRKKALHLRALLLEWFTVLWNIIEAGVAIVAGVIAGSTALVAFGADSLIEVTSAVGLLWRLYRARAGASAEEHSAAERKALYVVASTFFALAVYTAYESIPALLNRETPETSMVGLVLSVLSLIIMPVLAYAKQQTGQLMGSGALRADAIETWVCSYLSLALLAGVGLHAAFGWWWADAVGALAMLPVILWQGWETLSEVREEAEGVTMIADAQNF